MQLLEATLQLKKQVNVHDTLSEKKASMKQYYGMIQFYGGGAEEDKKKILTGVISQVQRDFGWFYFISHTFLFPKFFSVNVYYFYNQKKTISNILNKKK